jgi:hypothetical protein
MNILGVKHDEDTKIEEKVLPDVQEAHRAQGNPK